MKRIFKYELRVEAHDRIAMPAGAVVLSVGKQHIRGEERPVVWVIVDTDEPVQDVNFWIEVTGGSPDHILFEAAHAKFVGTFQLKPASASGAEFVGHVFTDAQVLR